MKSNPKQKTNRSFKGKKTPRKPSVKKARIQAAQQSNLMHKYFKQVVPFMIKQHHYQNSMAVPRLQKVVINCGIGPWLENKEMQTNVYNDLKIITAQKPVYTLAKQAISGFKIKQNQPVGIKVTLRGLRMYDFLERLITVALPRTKDFQGIPVANFGQKGNLNIGIKEHTAFAEIDTDTINYTFGFQVNIINSAQDTKESIALMKQLGFPIQ
ncbi:MAG: 50S ribosomal protein L5 [Candidatus Moranbacteria bacterium]|nr:50S ribosomal protein L5 [Candidatus Moranbacteria bacterium]